jgi:hypothetical protein
MGNGLRRSREKELALTSRSEAGRRTVLNRLRRISGLIERIQG